MSLLVRVWVFLMTLGGDRFVWIEVKAGPTS